MIMETVKRFCWITSNLFLLMVWMKMMVITTARWSSVEEETDSPDGADPRSSITSHPEHETEVSVVIPTVLVPPPSMAVVANGADPECFLNFKVSAWLRH